MYMDGMVQFQSAIRIITGLSQVSILHLSFLTLILHEGNWFRALNELGVATVYDPDEGTAAGGYFLASDIQPNNQTRSDARRAYYDPFFGRKNYNVLQNSHVTSILFDNQNEDIGHVSLHATGVEVRRRIPGAVFC